VGLTQSEGAADDEAAVGRDEDAAGGLPLDDGPRSGLGQRADDLAQLRASEVTLWTAGV